ncbi:MAG: phosphoglucomutase (alpha-D-glucose-1,6-bisphosphate-dependent) [Pseudomonadota bacterium]
MKPHPLAGQAAPPAALVDVARLVAAYYTCVPDPAVAAQRVAFGTSGHRGSSFRHSFNERHVLAISQAICDYRASHGATGPLFLGMDTHALSRPASGSALEVLAANGVELMLSAGDEYTPTPAVSLAILMHNRGRNTALADGILITPSHNPPDSGGVKYNPTHGGPADAAVTDWIGQRANALLEAGLEGVKRMSCERALRAATTHRYDFLGAYVDQLAQVIDMAAIGAAGVRIGVDPMGGAGVHYWTRIADRYRLALSVVNDRVDPTFAFMPLDRDGKIRMDPSSPYAMGRLIALRRQFDIACACDTDHDRHGIVTPDAGLLAPDHYHAVAIDYLFRHRPLWSARAGVGKTVVSSNMIASVAGRLGRPLFDAPVGFKWFAPGLLDGSLGFGGEESAGAAFLRIDGSCWTTDKDGLAAALLAAEITSITGRDPGQLYRALAREFGDPLSERVEAAATPAQKKVLAALAPRQLRSQTLGGDPITHVLTSAPGNGAPIGGVKVITARGWFAARPSGTEDLYKIYAESWSDRTHLNSILAQAQAMVDAALAAGAQAPES